MEHSALIEAFKWGGWPAVFLVVAVAFGKWYCTKKLLQDNAIQEKRIEQEKRIHEDRLKADRARDEMIAALANAVIALVYKTIDNEQAARVMADISKQHLESRAASARTEGL